MFTQSFAGTYPALSHKYEVSPLSNYQTRFAQGGLVSIVSSDVTEGLLELVGRFCAALQNALSSFCQSFIAVELLLCSVVYLFGFIYFTAYKRQ